MAHNTVQFQKGSARPGLRFFNGTEDQCREAAIRWRWPSGFVCPVCAGEHHIISARRKSFTRRNFLLRLTRRAGVATALFIRNVGDDYPLHVPHGAPGVAASSSIERVSQADAAKRRRRGAPGVATAFSLRIWSRRRDRSAATPLTNGNRRRILRF
jgi:hypothetical protein